MLLLSMRCLRCGSATTSSPLEVMDPRKQSANLNPRYKEFWTVIDMHWLTHSVSEESFGKVLYNKDGVIVRPHLNHSAQHYEVAVDYCPTLDKCVGIPFAVDREQKVAWLSSKSLIGSEKFIADSARAICDAENLSLQNCDHLKSRIEDAVGQQEGGGRFRGARLRARVNGKIEDSWDHPFPESIVVPSSLLVVNHVNTISLELSSYPGYNPGTTVGSPTTSEASFLYVTEECAGVMNQSKIIQPRSGGRYRSSLNLTLAEPLGKDSLGSLCLRVNNVHAKCGLERQTKISGLPVGENTIEVVRGNCSLTPVRFEVVDDYHSIVMKEGAGGDSAPPGGGIKFNLNYAGVELKDLNYEDIEEVQSAIIRGVPGVAGVSVDKTVFAEVVGKEDDGKEEKVVTHSLNIDILSRDIYSIFNGGDLEFVTGCNQQYYDDGRLRNLVGSMHHWEPHVPIIFYDLGLDASSAEDVRGWKNVEIRSIPNEFEMDGEIVEVPAHVSDPGTYAFKPLVVWDALAKSRNKAILWVDAGAELRRVLGHVREHIFSHGHFLVEHPYRFPNNLFHHPKCLETLGCVGVREGAMQHCATTFVGVFDRGAKRDAFIGVLKDMVMCAIEPKCINPDGSHRGNHRQEQTVMNSLFCRDGLADMCTSESR